MKRAAVALCDIFSKIIIIGFGIQTILGIVWMCYNMPSLRDLGVGGGFAGSYLHALAVDVFPFVYLLQLAAGVGVGFVTLKALAPKLSWQMCLYASIGVNFFPMVLQCHMSITPYSLGGTLLLGEIGLGAAMLRQKDTLSLRKFCTMTAMWCLMSLIIPMFFYVGLVPILAVVIAGRKQLLPGKRWVSFLILLLAFGGISLGLYGADPGNAVIPDREEAAFHLCSRIIWPKIGIDYYYGWPEELQELYKEDIFQITFYADEMEDRFRPMMLGTYGKDQAIRYYHALEKFALSSNGTLIARQALGDFGAYLCAPLALILQLRGRLSSAYVGRNYEAFLENVPMLSSVYMNFAIALYLLMLTGLVIMVLCRMCGKGKKTLSAVWMSLITIGLLCLLATLRGAGLMDYKITFVVTELVMLVGTVMTAKQKG